MLTRNRSVRAVAVLFCFLQALPVLEAGPPKVTVTPGTPNVWSMEQAHYLLNRLRANKDGLETKKPGPADLDPNAANGIRLDALQTFLGVAASYDQPSGTLNGLQMDQYKSASGRKQALIAAADQKRGELQAAELQTIQLQQQSAVLKAKKDQTLDADEAAALGAKISDLDARIAAQTASVAALRGQVNALTDAASGGAGAGVPGAAGAASVGGAVAMPTLTTPGAEYASPITTGILTDTFKTLLGDTASKWGQPKLHSSQILDNFVQMQYEIVAKQLTTLRDEVGKGQRVVFLELPASINAAAERKIPFVKGGEDRLAQTWWSLKKVYMAYDRDSSPCWVDGDDVYDGLQTQFGVRQGHDVDEVPKLLKTRGDGVTDSDKAATRTSTKSSLMLLEMRYQDLAKLRSAAGQSQLTYERAKRTLQNLQAREAQFMELAKKATDSPPATSAEQLGYMRSAVAIQGPLKAAGDARRIAEQNEVKARGELADARVLMEELLANIRSEEAKILNNGLPQDDNDSYSDAGLKKVAGPEQSCREAQIVIAQRELRHENKEKELKSGETAAEGSEEALAGNKREVNDIDIRLAQIVNESEKAAQEIGALLRRSEDATLTRSARDEAKTAMEQKQAENADRDEQARLAGQRRDLLIEARNAINSNRQRLERDRMDLADEKILLDADEAAFKDQLELQQMSIYAQFGGARGIQKAFRMDIRGGDSGMVRVLEVFPRQTALNVNSTHALTEKTAVSVAMKYLFGLGAKVDYERMREKYDQFVQQEVFASGFGKGATDFGWLFGPNPGTRVLNPGTRTTYAALTVPENATGLEIESAGCSFHHNLGGPASFPAQGDETCPAEERRTVTIGLPDRDSSGSFWVNSVSFRKVKPGERAIVQLKGAFSPETNVLVNGKRLTQVVGLGKPAASMDAGAAEDAGASVIFGSYEYVNEHYMTLSLNIPPDYKNTAFPAVTLISPSRAATINGIPMMVNGKLASLTDSGNGLLTETPDPLSLTRIEVLASEWDATRKVRSVHARLTGTRISKLSRLWVNGGEIPVIQVTKISDSEALVDFSDSETLQWSFLASSGESNAADRTATGFTINNPLELFISSVKLSDPQFKDKSPVKAVLLITGNGFGPDVRVEVNGATPRDLAFAAPNQFTGTAEIKIGATQLLITLTPASGKKVSRIVALPKKPVDPQSSDEQKGKTTVTEIQTQKTVTEKP